MDFISLLNEHFGEILTIFGLGATLIEVSPMRLNPWTYIFNGIGKRLNAEVFTRLNELETKLKAQDEKIDYNERNRIKFEILDFANSCRNGRQHTREEFNHIIAQYDEYEMILTRLKKPNGQITRAMHYLSDLYNDNLKNDSFLPD